MDKPKSDITDLEFHQLNAREGSRLERSRIPHCYAKWIGERPECNHLVPTKNPGKICELRRSCLIDYARRLGLDVNAECAKAGSFSKLAARVHEEEIALGKSNVIKPTAPVVKVAPAPIVASTVPAIAVVVSPSIAEDGKAPAIRSIVLSHLAERADTGSTKKDIYDRVESVRGVPNKKATKHQIDLVLQQKQQQKYGYTVDKFKMESGVQFYRLANGQTEKGTI